MLIRAREVPSVPEGDRHIVVTLGQPQHVTEPLVRGNRDRVEPECSVALRTNVRNHPEIVRRARDKEIVTVLLAEFERSLEFRSGGIELAELEIRHANHVDGATERRGIAASLDHRDGVGEPCAAFAWRPGTQVGLAAQVGKVRLVSDFANVIVQQGGELAPRASRPQCARIIL